MRGEAPRPRPFRRRRVAGLAALATGIALLLIPQSAEAGSYTVRQCTASNPGAEVKWERTADHYRGRNRCPSGEGLQIHHEGARTAHRRYGAWIWRAPEGTIFSSLRWKASLAAHAGHRGELWTVPEDGPWQRVGGDHRGFRSYEHRGQLSRFEARLRCVRTRGCGNADRDQAHAHVKGISVRVTDRAAPTVTALAGTLLDDPVVRGSRSLAFIAGDRGGGVRRVSVAANGTRLAGAVRECLTSGRSATSLVPCPTKTAETRAIATTHPAFVTGPNVIAACAEDLAFGGEPNRSCEERRVWVDNACPSSDHAVASLAAAFSGNGARAVVRSNRRAVLGGRLIDELGGPVSGATVCVLSRVMRDGEPVRIAATEPSGVDGRFSVELPPGPNREVFVHHAAGDRVTARHGLSIRSRARPTLTVRAPRRPRRGDVLRFAGRLPSPACAGRLVEVEARLAQRRWQVFRTARTGERCRFRARYRLRATTRPTGYRFRARVRRQPGYPYVAGHSAVRTQRVTG